MHKAVAALAKIIAAAPADAAARDRWLARLLRAYRDDAIPYIESLDDHWDDLCGSPEVAARWADEVLAANAFKHGIISRILGQRLDEH